jgi:hypothetical protein
MVSGRLPARRVRRLHVRAADEDDARHAVTLLSDALHTVSLPGADQGQLIVIQRLALGRIARGASPSTLALLIERATSEAMADAVAYDLPPADTANVVAFPDRGEAIAVLAGRHARDLFTGHWFWPAVVPGWDSGLPRAERWRLLLDVAHGVPAAPIVVAAIVHRACAAGRQDEMLACIPAGRGAAWLRALGWHDHAPAPPSRAAEVPGGYRIEAPQRLQPAWPASDGRLVWLRTMLAVHANPSRAADSRLPATIAAAFLPRSGNRPAPPVDSARAPVLAGVEIEPTRSPDAAFAPDVGEARKSTTGERSSSADRERVDEFTPCGGLLFLVAVLERLGFGAYLGRNPALLENEFPARLLWLIGARVGMQSDDPQALALLRAAAGADERRGLDVADLPEPARDVLARPTPRSAIDTPSAAWLVAVRRWCRRSAHQGLVSLIRRPARVQISRTHIDVRFDLSQLDVRLRRVALDVDPGWVPWLGKVVRFTFD